MKTLIAGGTGLIGGALSRSLVADGHEVVVLTRKPDERPDRLPDAVRLIGWDGKTGEGWSDELPTTDVVVNLAGATIGPEGGLWAKARKQAILQSRVQSTAALIDGLRRVDQRPATLIQGSAVGFYGGQGSALITEEAPNGDDFLADVVAAWEAASDDAETLGLRRVLLRTGVVLAAKGGTLNLLALPHKLFVGGPLGNGKQYIPWVHIDDEVAAIRFLMEQPDLSGPFNITAPNPVTNRAMSNALGKVLGRPSLLPTPAFLLKLLLGEMSVLVLEGQRALPEALTESGFDFHFPNIEGALRDLL